MEKVKIKVEFNKYSSRYYVTAKRGRFHICTFWKSDISNMWYFSPSVTATKIPIFAGVCGTFPIDYLISLTKSVWFLSFGTTGELPEVELTQVSKKLLGIK